MRKDTSITEFDKRNNSNPNAPWCKAGNVQGLWQAQFREIRIHQDALCLDWPGHLPWQLPGISVNSRWHTLLKLFWKSRGNHYILLRRISVWSAHKHGVVTGHSQQLHTTVCILQSFFRITRHTHNTSSVSNTNRPRVVVNILQLYIVRVTVKENN